MEISTIQKQIKEKNVSNFYIFTGEEIAVQDIYVKKISECAELPFTRSESVSEIMLKLNSKAFITSNKCYVVHNDNEFLKADTAWDKVISNIRDNVLILIYDNKDKRGKFYKRFTESIATFEHLGEDILTKYIQKHIDLSVPNCKTLIDICEFDYSRILLEIDKIKQYKQTTQEYNGHTVWVSIPCDAVFQELVENGTIYKPPKDAIFDLVDSICRGNIEKSYCLYEDCKSINESPLVIISVLYNNMKQMLQVQSCKDKDVSKVTGLNGWIVQQARDKLGAYTTGELVNALKTIQSVETQIKTGEIEQDIAVDYIMLNILRS